MNRAGCPQVQLLCVILGKSLNASLDMGGWPVVLSVWTELWTSICAGIWEGEGVSIADEQVPGLHRACGQAAKQKPRADAGFQEKA